MTDLAPPGTMDDTNRAAAADLLLQAAALEAKGLSDPADVLAAARLILERARRAKREREVTAYETGYRDGYDKRLKAAHAYTDDADLEAYAEGYGDGCQLREDERLEQIERDHLGGACSIGGHYY